MPRVVKLYGVGVGQQAGYGSGTIVSEDGLVVTVQSLLVDAGTIRATLHDGTRCEADLLYRDEVRQLVLLRLRPPTKLNDRGEVVASDAALPPLAYFDLSREAALRRGDWVVAAGNPFKVADGPEPVSIAHGVFGIRTRLDATRRTKDFPYRGEVLVIDAVTSNLGAPGSAVVNLDGEFVGIIGRNVIAALTHTHINYAMPRDVLAEFVREAGETRKRGNAETRKQEEATGSGAEETRKPETVDLGIKLATAGYRTVLPFVERVRLGSPAAAAGVRRDDLILSINGRGVADVDECQKRLDAIALGEVVELVIQRERSIVSLRIEETSKRRNVETSKPERNDGA